jgi:thiosulfate sulfurtransferase
MNRTIEPAELSQWLQQGHDTEILDVRKKADFDLDPKMLPGARWREPAAVTEWGAELSGGAPIVVYCVHGHAVSNGVVDHLREQGLDACLIEGGIEAWKQAGGTTV